MNMNEIFKMLNSGDDVPSGSFYCLFFVRDQGENNPYVGYYSEAAKKWFSNEADDPFEPYKISAWVPLNSKMLEKAIEAVDASSEGKAQEDEEHRIALQAEPEYREER